MIELLATASLLISVEVRDEVCGSATACYSPTTNTIYMRDYAGFLEPGVYEIDCLKHRNHHETPRKMITRLNAGVRIMEANGWEPAQTLMVPALLAHECGHANEREDA